MFECSLSIDEYKFWTWKSGILLDAREIFAGFEQTFHLSAYKILEMKHLDLNFTNNFLSSQVSIALTIEN